MSKEDEQSSQKHIISKEDIAATVTADTVPGKFRKRQHQVEAMQFLGNNNEQILHWMKNQYEKHGIDFVPFGYNKGKIMDGLMIRDVDYDVFLSLNHWMVFSHQKRFYVLPPDIFADTYEEIDA